MRILFLDFDGVLNDDSYLFNINETPFVCKHAFLDKYSLCDNLDPKKIDRLNRIVDETGCFIVLSTSWRDFGIDSCKNVLMMRGFRFPHRIIDSTPIAIFKDNRRIREILLWLTINDIERDISNYVMLDDEVSEEGEELIGSEHCVITHFCEDNKCEGGLNEVKEKELIQKLTVRRK